MMVGRGLVNCCAVLLALLVSVAATPSAKAEDGYALWLRYAPLEGEALERLRAFNPRVVSSVYPGDRRTIEVAIHELNEGLAGLAGQPDRHPFAA